MRAFGRFAVCLVLSQLYLYSHSVMAVKILRILYWTVIRFLMLFAYIKIMFTFRCSLGLTEAAAARFWSGWLITDLESKPTSLATDMYLVIYISFLKALWSRGRASCSAVNMPAAKLNRSCTWRLTIISHCSVSYLPLHLLSCFKIFAQAAV